jgi:hypothetical protein
MPGLAQVRYHPFWDYVAGKDTLAVVPADYTVGLAVCMSVG